MTNYELYQLFIKISTRNENRSKWLGPSVVYKKRIQLIKKETKERLEAREYTGYTEYSWLSKILEWST